MNELRIFENKEFGEIRIVEKDGEPWFVAADVCKALDIANVGNALARLDDDEKGSIRLTDVTPNGGNPNVSIVNEPGLYALILGSRKPEAKAFKRWITHEVIPAIRKNGAYIIPEALGDLHERDISLKRAELLERIAGDYTGTYRQILQAYATRELTGDFVLPLPVLERKTYSAREIGEMLGVSKNVVGKLANSNNLKTDAYGKWFADKSPYSNKEVQSFRYYDSVIPVLRGLL